MFPVPVKMTGKLDSMAVVNAHVQDLTGEHSLDVLNPTIGITLGEEVRNCRSNGANEEEEHQSLEIPPSVRLSSYIARNHNTDIVHLALVEYICWPNDTPDDARRPKHSCTRADETILLVGRAHTLDIGEHPGLDTQLGSQ